MKVTWKWKEPQALNPDEIVLTIACQCGNKRMMTRREGEFTHENIYVYRYGTKVKNVRCCEANPENKYTIGAGKKVCGEFYRITLRADEEKEHFVEVEHLGAVPKEVMRIPFQKVSKKSQPMYTTTPWPPTNPYEKKDP